LENSRIEIKYERQFLEWRIHNIIMPHESEWSEAVERKSIFGINEDDADDDSINNNFIFTSFN
jgi:hypothetical protein